ncbi:hypothetical protein R1flu_008147 [Riccia fluitans]|uniref:Uncharacterized protein n=1 Tax=Riccia fluitans TaxID=41844 RepID=A0ABD1YDZ2_9MARC
MLTWILKFGDSQAFKWNLTPHLEELSLTHHGLSEVAHLAVLCVNVVIAGYIFLTLHESTPATEPHQVHSFNKSKRKLLLLPESRLSWRN